ncbi:hypothetical protein VO226_09060 [Halomonas elongata]|uniref:hypothetical protein n=1 Tax=Halomonas elongata TaxID=2746 RepID=UPI002E2C1584|nr:hypothetical protein [Halomonas elongata]WVI70097.1 hypothetical protein VO226_09060 [Halomonas elongata]
MKKVLPIITLSVMISTPVMANPGQESEHAHQENWQKARAHYQEKRDRISGADRLPKRDTPRDNAFLDAPVDTSDSPDLSSDNVCTECDLYNDASRD